MSFWQKKLSSERHAATALTPDMVADWYERCHEASALVLELVQQWQGKPEFADRALRLLKVADGLYNAAYDIGTQYAHNPAIHAALGQQVAPHPGRA